MRIIPAVVYLIISIFIAAAPCLAADNFHPRTTFKADRAPRFMVPFERVAGSRPNPSGTTPLSLREPPPTNSPGNSVGQNYYDLQHTGSMGRQIAGNQSNGFIFMAWTDQNNAVIPGNRGIKIQAYDASIADYVLEAGGSSATWDYAGYTTCAWSPNNEAAFVCQTDPGTGVNKTTYYNDGLPNCFIFYFRELDGYHDASWYSTEIIWPTLSVHEGDSSNVTEDVIYVLSRVYTDSKDLILYRQVAGVWDSGQYIESVDNWSYIVCADPNSDFVAIVYTDDMHELSPGEGGQTDLDVYYKLSTDQGNTWGDQLCVSYYSAVDDSLWRAYADLSGVITPDGYLHIIAPVRELRSQDSYELYKSRLVHWDVELPWGSVSKASIIDEAHYYMSLDPSRPCDPDDWNLYIAKPSISYCDGKLYALYTKFGDDNEPGALIDCSQAGFANGELYLAASNDNGATWDTAWNLTKTRTPLCDSAFCESDHWSSMDAYGMAYDGADDTLDIIYINDKDAGGIPHGSGTWCVNNVMHYRFPCRDVMYTSRISLEPPAFLDPIHTAPDAPVTVNLKISNIGNLNLNVYSVTAIDEGDGTNWINIGSFNSTIGPNDFTDVSITLNYDAVLSTGPDPAGYDASIEVDHDGPSDREYVPIHLTIASDFNMPQKGILNTTCKQLMVYNTGRLGGDNDGYSLDIPGDCDSVDIRPNAFMYLNNASPMIAWNNGEQNVAYTTIFSQYFTESGTFRPQSDLNFYSEAAYDRAVCTVTTSDSLFGVAIDLYAPTDGANCFIIGKYNFFNWNPVKSANEVWLGFVCDWDIPSDNSVDNGSFSYVYDKIRTMGQFGQEYGSDNNAACGGSEIPETDRYGGMAVFQGAVLNGWGAENAPHQLGSGFDKEFIYAQMSTLEGYVEFAGDSLIDLHTGMTFEMVDMTAEQNKEYVIALVTTNQGWDDYLAQVDQAYNWAVNNEIIFPFVCNCTPGDANGDGQVGVGDAVYIISYVFKGGPPPTPYPRCSGDANGDCRCNVCDAVYLYGYVLKGGPPAVNCETWHTNCGDLQK